MDTPQPEEDDVDFAMDPLDVIGTNADLVALARVEGLARGDVYRHLYPGHAGRYEIFSIWP